MLMGAVQIKDGFGQVLIPILVLAGCGGFGALAYVTLRSGDDNEMFAFGVAVVVAVALFVASLIGTTTN